MKTPPEPELDAALAACLASMEQHGSGALEAACAARPDLAEALRRRVGLLATAQLIDLEHDVGRLPARLGDFDLDERIGMGAMGIVHRARQRSTGREVALKLVRPEQLVFPGARERFRREVELTARLHDPAILPVLAVGEDDGLPWFALELVRGASLAALLDALRSRSDGGLGPDPARVAALLFEVTPESLREPASSVAPRTWSEFAIGVARQVARALAHAHGQGVLHRDVKPSNVMLGLDGSVALTDFGLASAAGAATLTMAGGAVGSLPYMAPELLGGGAADAQSDVYGAGALLYELLTLRRPFEAPTASGLVAAVLAGSPTPPRRLDRRISRDAEAVVLRALERDPARRYPTAWSLLEDLDHLERRLPTRARPAGPLARFARWTLRRPAVSAAVLSSALLVVGVPSARRGRWRRCCARRARTCSRRCP